MHRVVLGIIIMTIIFMNNSSNNAQNNIPFATLSTQRGQHLQ